MSIHGNGILQGGGCVEVRHERGVRSMSMNFPLQWPERCFEYLGGYGSVGKLICGLDHNLVLVLGSGGERRGGLKAASWKEELRRIDDQLIVTP